MKSITVLFLLIFTITNTQAQDYLINFAGAGDTSVVGIVRVDNLTSGVTVTLNGGDVLHLKSTLGIEVKEISDHHIKIQPNPLTDQAVLKFIAPGKGDISIFIFDVSGKTVCKTHVTVLQGENSFLISGIHQGIYFLKINGDNYCYSTKIISQGNAQGGAKIEYISTVRSSKNPHLKSSYSTIDMPYSTGDILLYTGTSGQYGTVITDIPNGNKDITFNFVLCKDNEGNNYTTVQIGTQIWMVGNLNTTVYNDGAPIPLITDSVAWSKLVTDGYCWYKNDAGNKNTYGALYNWFAVNTGKLAPAGWHIPTDDEWTTLTTYLGGESSAAGKLKETGTTHWRTPNAGAINETGFTALPAGHRDINGSYSVMGDDGYWWTQTEYGTSGKVWYRNMDYNNTGVISANNNKKNGHSVRCIKDANTPPVVPTVTTFEATNISQATATCGGTVTSDGGTTVTARGVCWSTLSNPTTGDSHTSDGSGTGAFTSNLTNLTEDTLYYVRAYATNSQGTGYGNQVTFTSTLTVTDIDGNVYHAVTIGQQVWMVGNLRTTKLNDGTSIPNVTADTAWQFLNTPAYCWTYNDISYKDDYGAYYNWFTVNTGKLCPTGWHVPADAEWTILTDYLGGDSVAGGKIKEAGTTHWESPNKATNETGLTILPGGERFAGGAFQAFGYMSYLWSSTMRGTVDAWMRYLANSYSDIGRAYYIQWYGLSVRCIQDSEGFTIGQNYGGGIIFYIDSTGQHGLIAATSNQDTAPWGCSGTSISGTSWNIGMGQQNTTSIVNGCSEASIAARICNDLVLNGNNDWFLPSFDELQQMYEQRNVIGGLTGGVFWSSTEANNNSSFAIDFADGSGYGFYKDNTSIYVRAIRAF